MAGEELNSWVHPALKMHELWNLESLTTFLTMPSVMALSVISVLKYKAEYLTL